MADLQASTQFVDRLRIVGARSAGMFTSGSWELSNTPHTLRDEFPDQIDAIHALKAKSPEFSRVLEEYDEVNDQIHRAETRITPVSDEAEEALRKKRLALKDAIVSALENS